MLRQCRDTGASRENEKSKNLSAFSIQYRGFDSGCCACVATPAQHLGIGQRRFSEPRMDTDHSISDCGFGIADWLRRRLSSRRYSEGSARRCAVFAELFGEVLQNDVRIPPSTFGMTTFRVVRRETRWKQLPSLPGSEVKMCKSVQKCAVLRCRCAKVNIRSILNTRQKQCDGCHADCAKLCRIVHF